MGKRKNCGIIMCCGGGKKTKAPKTLFKPSPGTNKIQVTRKTVVDGVMFVPGKTYFVDEGVAEKLKGSIA